MQSTPEEKEGRWQVYFASPAVATSYVMPARTVVLSQTLDRWNDFGKRTGVEIRVQPPTGDVIELHGRIGFYKDAPQAAGIEVLGELTADTSSPVTVDSKTRFFTMLTGLEDYRGLVQALGQELSQSLLLALYDVVALREFGKAPDWLDAAERTDVFAMSFVRNSTAYYAYRTAGPLLQGLAFEELGRLSGTLQVTLDRGTYHRPATLKFSFDHQGELPKRIAVIIGKNGVGKSQTLAAVASEALSGKLTEADGQTRAVISRLLAFAPTNEAESVFPPDKSKRHKIWYRRFSLNRARRSRRGDYVSDLLLQVARSPTAIQLRTRSDLLLEALKAIHASEQLALTTREGGMVPLSRLLSGRGGEQANLEIYQAIDPQREPMRATSAGLFPLSSGEVSFLKFAAQICLHIENGSLVLLDEPETHLHPNFISRFISLLDTVLELTGSSALLATHSAYVVKEVFKEQVTVLRLHEGELSAIPPTMQTFGADVGAVSYFVFGEDEPTRLAVKLKDEILKQNNTWEAIFDRYKGQVSLEYLNMLRLAAEGQ